MRSSISQLSLTCHWCTDALKNIFSTENIFKRMKDTGKKSKISIKDNKKLKNRDWRESESKNSKSY